MLGIIGAMEEEVQILIGHLKNKKETEIIGYKYYSGKLENTDVIIVKSGVGLVNMALCCQVMLDNWDVDFLINCGIAGGIDDNINSGDVIVSSDATYFEIDYNYLGTNWAEIHNMERSSFKASKILNDKIVPIIKNYLPKENKVIVGTICSSDYFIESVKSKELIHKLTNGLCVEMEGAAMGHVCYLNKIPFTVIRIVADVSDGDAKQDYINFKKMTCDLTNHIAIELCKHF